MKLALILTAIALCSACAPAPQSGSAAREAPHGSRLETKRERERARSGARTPLDVPVPSACTPAVNAPLASLASDPPPHAVDNVMVCGMTISASRRRAGGRHGAHDLLPVLAPFPDGSGKLVEVVINEALDGGITAPAHVPVFAFGQAYFDNTGKFVAGIHDVHCSTHRGADNGWVVVNGVKSPASCPMR